ncbi:MAG TPA: hypothetical protein VGM24_04630 [Puia sp.]
MKIIWTFFFFLGSLISSKAQEMLPDTNALKSVDGIVKEMLRLESGKKGQIRNFKALRNLFLPTATFTILNDSDFAGQPTETVSLDDFMKLLHDEYYEEGYLEYETGKTIDEFNGIANVFQSFYGKDSEKREARGINSYQLVYFGKRWWIASILWTLESNKVKIPKKYLRQN